MELTKETILIVDDSRFQRAVIKELFSEHFHLLETVSGLECMHIIEENAENIDLVLLDLVMPGIDGFEVLRRRQEMQDFLDIFSAYRIVFQKSVHIKNNALIYTIMGNS